MKKFICVTLCVLMPLATVASLSACGEKSVKLGLGQHAATPTCSASAASSTKSLPMTFYVQVQ